MMIFKWFNFSIKRIANPNLTRPTTWLSVCNLQINCELQAFRSNYIYLNGVYRNVVCLNTICWNYDCSFVDSGKRLLGNSVQANVFGANYVRITVFRATVFRAKVFQEKIFGQKTGNEIVVKSYLKVILIIWANKFWFNFKSIIFRMDFVKVTTYKFVTVSACQ